MMSHERVFLMRVQDRPGVLTRVAGAFFRRGINIINLTVGATHEPGISKMVIRSRGTATELLQLSRLLENLIDVRRVELLDPEADPVSELCFVRISVADEAARGAVLDAASPYRAEVVTIEHDSMVLQLSSTPLTIDHFIERLRAFALLDVSRTGVTTTPGRG